MGLMKGFRTALERPSSSWHAGNERARGSLQPGELASRACGLDPELGRDDDLVPTPASEPAQFPLCGAKPVHPGDVEVADALLEGFGKESLPMSTKG